MEENFYNLEPLNDSLFTAEPRVMVIKITNLGMGKSRFTNDEGAEVEQSKIVMEYENLAMPGMYPRRERFTDSRSPSSKWQRWLSGWKTLGVDPRNLIGVFAKVKEEEITFGKGMSPAKLLMPIHIYKDEADAMADVAALFPNAPTVKAAGGEGGALSVTDSLLLDALKAADGDYGKFVGLAMQNPAITADAAVVSGLVDPNRPLLPYFAGLGKITATPDGKYKVLGS